jgi:hypothetical protein
MIGHSVFTHNPTTDNTTANDIRVTEQQYEDWQRQFTIDALLGQRYGQSFCNRFGIEDNLLFFTVDIAWCERYIKDMYIERRRV